MQCVGRGEFVSANGQVYWWRLIWGRIPQYQRIVVAFHVINKDSGKPGVHRITSTFRSRQSGIGIEASNDGFRHGAIVLRHELDYY